MVKQSKYRRRPCGRKVEHAPQYLSEAVVCTSTAVSECSASAAAAAAATAAASMAAAMLVPPRVLICTVVSMAIVRVALALSTFMRGSNRQERDHGYSHERIEHLQTSGLRASICEA